MTLKAFLQVVEIQTKLASIVPLSLGTVYALYRYEMFKWWNFATMLVSLLAIDMATTAINNYFDYRKARENGAEVVNRANPIAKNNLSESMIQMLILGLLTIAVVCGLLLVWRTNVIVLLVGVLSFFAGVFYTFGPVPISRMPLGELFSGLFMGFIITFLAVYIHVYDQGIVALAFAEGILTVQVDAVEILSIFLIAIPAIAGIANIMLANNICDVDEDVLVKRFTLPFYLGRRTALKLFEWLYYLGYLAILTMVVSGVAPTLVVLALVAVIPVRTNVITFQKRPVKRETFALSVKNFVLLNVPHVLLVAFAAFDKVN